MSKQPEVGSEAWWDDISQRWMDKKDNRDRPKEFLALSRLLDGGPVYELGCGFGAFSTYISPKTYYIGVDISKKMVEEARKRYPGRVFIHSNLLLTNMDAWEKAYSFTASFQTLEHFNDADFVRIMDTLKFISRKGLLFSVPSEPMTAHEDHKREWKSEEELIKDFSRWGRVQLIPTPEEKHYSGVIWYEHSDNR
jgi:SAM-dependent methyltransferase